MLVHLFQYSSTPLYCLACDHAVEAIPTPDSDGDWRYIKDVMLEPGDQRLAIDSAAALADVETYGYHLVDGWYKTV